MKRKESMLNLKRLPDTKREEVDRWVEVDGIRYDLVYLLDMLEEIEMHSGRCGGIAVFDKECEHLKSIGVLKTCGNKSFYEGATKGENFDEVLDFLREERESEMEK